MALDDKTRTELESAVYRRLVEHLRTKVRLTELHRHHPPRTDRDIYWRPAPGTHWPKGWLET